MIVTCHTKTEIIKDGPNSLGFEEHTHILKYIKYNELSINVYTYTQNLRSLSAAPIKAIWITRVVRIKIVAVALIFRSNSV